MTPPPDELADQLFRSRGRVGHVLALVSGLAGACVLGLLWLTEPALPFRTRMAFLALLVVCAFWAVYGGWSLIRRPLLGLDRVVAGWAAVAVSVATTAGLTTIAASRGSGMPLAALVGAAFLVVASALTIRAHLRRAALLRRKRDLGG
ncbi:hypothetical protein ACIBHX_40325 [Nonomuraea sp. NPDC050536]|uniref:hypothetical protein n=1 Tax=Nonomuraea sp. NPDC050536 TaxID=3364366 RepID=UPI0037C66B58